MTDLETSIAAIAAQPGICDEARRFIEAAQMVASGESTLEKVVSKMAVDFPNGDSQQ